MLLNIDYSGNNESNFKLYKRKLKKYAQKKKITNTDLNSENKDNKIMNSRT
jgi:hypothetical protein